ncbi:unnamed protein product [Orchesella dallaii]|uniref:G-protein coupled receptors family 1 profile domain-containing protein n=1 Tax=Orchesella dallaii TaxID=48710 RepID=A0ABP1QEI7_9HEXA
MPATSIFDYGLLGYLSQNQSWTSSSEEGNSFFIDSSEGGGNGAVYFETDFGTTNHENHNEPEGETNVVAVVAAMASSTINSSLSTISQTIGEYLTTPFSDLASAEIMMSYNNNTLGDTISHSSGTPQNLSELSKGELEKSSLKLPSATIPESFRKLSTNSRNCVIAYVILFCIGAPGNLFVFVSVGREIWRRQLMRSRIKVLIWHLATADLFVTFVVIPIEVFWRLTIQWYGGDVLCKMAQFFRAFGLYLSSMVIICISMDRFFAIVFPLKVIGGMKRVRNMLGVAWTFSILFAAPQFDARVGVKVEAVYIIIDTAYIQPKITY